MKVTELPLEALPGERYGFQKQRFRVALGYVAPHMDRFYSGGTLRRFARTPSHVRNIKQAGVVDWEVLRYWANEYLPPALLPQAWLEKEEVAA